AGVMDPHVRHGQGDVLGEGAGTIDADSLGVAAEVPATRETVATAATDHVPLAADDVAHVEIMHIGADLDDGADELMANRHGNGDGPLGPGVPLVDMEVGSA